ncbi:hypothetical protein [Myroides pelagicus]|uniref:Uncharacterized protein n=1 Tax=Myroides pelagicus TaxID=270914 RepID=A0A7K1GM14_9FLAO|nr:hypothetical protein [Myroides pelagicus]MTH29942.1 hypothetical protein [Myroides pelagicus]
MRNSQNILSILMLLLVVAFTQYPCTDRYFVSESLAERVFSESSNPIEKQSTHTSSDMCSPLCVCACCAAVSNAKVYVFQPVTTSLLFFQETPTYSDKLPQKVDITIWQPPKIVI